MLTTVFNVLMNRRSTNTQHLIKVKGRYGRTDEIYHIGGEEILLKIKQGVHVQYNGIKH